ncbi:hypothetical protein HPB50_010718 [Hyalomma asiaticum]|uniref:Uncharacterized protein n=1 Tax=Hyalomma asiaticum TaxID=266040 RepID=A0ACB7RVH5_HYAAI|nr:hypothetical protein HPB50_010718 [Hyalomma asiaticum]
MTPHDCKPCLVCDMVCGEGHLIMSQASKARFTRLQQPGGHRGGCGCPQQRQTPKTERRQPGAINQAPKNPVARCPSLSSKQTPSPPTTSEAPQKTSTKTPDQGVPKLQAVQFPLLSAASTLRHPAKKTSAQVGKRAVTASSPPPSTEIAVGTQEPERMCSTASVTESCNIEECFQAIESAMSALVAQLTTMTKTIENVSNTVTHQVTSNIKTWLHGTYPRSRTVPSRTLTVRLNFLNSKTSQNFPRTPNPNLHRALT